MRWLFARLVLFYGILAAAILICSALVAAVFIFGPFPTYATGLILTAIGRGPGWNPYPLFPIFGCGLGIALGVGVSMALFESRWGLIALPLVYAWNGWLLWQGVKLILIIYHSGV